MDLLPVIGLRVVFLIYMTIVLLHSTLQRRYARIAASGPREGFGSLRAGGGPWADAGPDARWLPSIDVVVPCFNEDPALLASCCASLARQDYGGTVRVWLVDDGSANREALRSVYDRYGRRPGWMVVMLDAHVGKRRAQAAAMHHGEGELVVLMDSDTVLAPDALRRVVDAFGDHSVGAVAGQVGVLNAGANLLTRLVDRRYWLRFQFERAAQGAFGAVLCSSGPFSVYRRVVLARLWPRYLGQTLWGIPCMSGDDLHLTNLLLADGHHVVYEPRARALTEVPATLRQYLRQQLRWSRSFYRELRWTAPVLRRRHPYLALDVLARALLPLLLATALALAALEGMLAGRVFLVHDLSLLGAMVTVNVAFVAVHSRNAAFTFLYGLLHVALLIPVRVQALLTLGDPRWGTR